MRALLTLTAFEEWEGCEGRRCFVGGTQIPSGVGYCGDGDVVVMAEYSGVWRRGNRMSNRISTV